jgi:hypothetical protein
MSNQFADRDRFEAVGLVLRPVPSLSLPIDCTEWAGKLRAMLRQELSSERANTLHRSSADVRKVGFPVEGILHEAGDFIREYFGMSPENLDIHACFAVAYSKDANTKLRLHVDDSDVTLNICLEKSDDLKGTDVVFHGSEALSSLPKLNFGSLVGPVDQLRTSINVPAGWVAIHRGRHAHETTSLQQGSRLSVICWFKYVLNTEMAIAKYAHYYGRPLEHVTIQEVEASVAGAKAWAEADLPDFGQAQLGGLRLDLAARIQHQPIKGHTGFVVE